MWPTQASSSRWSATRCAANRDATRTDPCCDSHTPGQPCWQQGAPGTSRLDCGMAWAGLRTLPCCWPGRRKPGARFFVCSALTVVACPHCIVACHDPRRQVDLAEESRAVPEADARAYAGAPLQPLRLMPACLHTTGRSAHALQSGRPWRSYAAVQEPCFPHSPSIPPHPGSPCPVLQLRRGWCILRRAPRPT